MKVLWLASWYPNPESPFDGDFVQRHAKAVSAFVPVTVFFVSQSGVSGKINQTKLLETQSGDLKERIVFFSFFKTGLSFVDKLIYNWQYYSTYKKYIRKYIIKEGIPDLVHVHIPLKAGIVAQWMQRKWGIPYIVTEHSSHYDKDSSDSYFNKSALHRRLVTSVFKEAAWVTNVSLALGKTLKNLFNLKNTETIHNVVDCSLFFYKAKQQTDHGVFRFIHVSTLKERQKNASGILKAIQILAGKRQDFQFVIVGPADDSLKQKAVQYGVDKIIVFTGELAYTAVAEQMRQASAFVLFSRYENFPCVIVEALCCGLPIITTGVGGIKEAVGSNNGIIVESEKEKDLAAAMADLIDNYNNYDRMEIATSSKEKFSFEAIGNQFYNRYENVISNK